MRLRACARTAGDLCPISQLFANILARLHQAEAQLEALHIVRRPASVSEAPKRVQDSRAAVRVPFTQIVPTVAKVVDTSNEGSSGAGWSIGEGGLVRPGLAGGCRARPAEPRPALTR